MNKFLTQKCELLYVQCHDNEVATIKRDICTHGLKNNFNRYVNQYCSRKVHTARKAAVINPHSYSDLVLLSIKFCTL